MAAIVTYMKSCRLRGDSPVPPDIQPYLKRINGIACHWDLQSQFPYFVQVCKFAISG